MDCKIWSNIINIEKVIIIIGSLFSTSILYLILTSSSENLSNAVTTYQVAWRHIASIGGEDLPNKKTKVTFYGRT